MRFVATCQQQQNTSMITASTLVDNWKYRRNHAEYWWNILLVTLWLCVREPHATFNGKLACNLPYRRHGYEVLTKLQATALVADGIENLLQAAVHQTQTVSIHMVVMNKPNANLLQEILICKILRDITCANLVCRIHKRWVIDCIVSIWG